MTPNTSADFDRAYQLPFTFWGDVRIPSEVKSLGHTARSALELGCGVGRFSRWLAQRDVRVVAVDFSPVAIERAKVRAAGDPRPPEYRVGDVTQLVGIDGPFDVAFDVGCFHCLRPDAQARYVAEAARLVRPGGTHLIWALDHTPADLVLDPDTMRRTFGPSFTLRDARPSRRRLVASHWYWLERTAN